MADEEINEVLASFPIRVGWELRITKSHYRGQDLIDIRLWLDRALPPAEGEWKPTKKGIALRPELLEKLIEALGEAQRKLNKTQS